MVEPIRANMGPVVPQDQEIVSLKRHLTIAGGSEPPRKMPRDSLWQAATKLFDWAKLSRAPQSSRSLHAVFALQEQRITAANQTLQNLRLGDSEGARLLGHLANQLRASRMGEDRPATKQEQRACAKLNNEVVRIIAGELQKDGLSVKDARKSAWIAFNQASLQCINNANWETINTSFTCHGNDYDCTLVPAGQMRLYEGKEAVFTTPYDGHGVCCSSTKETSHAANLWSSEIATKDAIGRPETLFKGIRHAVLSPYRVSDPYQRREGALAGAKEVVTAALFSQEDKLEEALQGNTVTLRLASISLLTPGLKGEGKMLNDQMDAWNRLTSQPQPISWSIRDEQGNLRQIKVRLEIAACNFGVNVFSLKFGLGNKQSDKLSEPGLQRMLGSDLRPGEPLGGWVGDYIKQNPYARNVERVKVIAEQLKTILATHQHHHDRGEPYKVSQRLAMLAYEIGAVPAWNCKSGKDRTGILDAEIKREAIAMHEGAPPSEPGVPLDVHGQEMFHQALLHGGNLEVQQYNAGSGGSKVLSESELMFTPLNLSFQQRIGNKEVWDEAKGLAQYYKPYNT